MESGTTPSSRADPDRQPERHSYSLPCPKRVAVETPSAGIALHYDDGQRRHYPFWIVVGDVYQGVRWPHWPKAYGRRPSPPFDEDARAHLLLLTEAGQLIRTD